MIRVNGDEVSWREGLTVREMLADRNYRFPLLIVTVNGEWVAPADYDRVAIPDGADVQAIHMMSGG